MTNLVESGLIVKLYFLILVGVVMYVVCLLATYFVFIIAYMYMYFPNTTSKDNILLKIYGKGFSCLLLRF